MTTVMVQDGNRTQYAISAPDYWNFHNDRQNRDYDPHFMHEETEIQ